MGLFGLFSLYEIAIRPNAENHKTTIPPPHSCVLEYEEPPPGSGSEDRFVLINDLYYTRKAHGQPWAFRKSQFRKLEIPPQVGVWGRGEREMDRQGGRLIPNYRSVVGGANG